MQNVNCLVNKSMFEHAKQALGSPSIDRVHVDLETTGLDYHTDSIVGVGVAAPGMNFYFPVGHNVGENVPLCDVVEIIKDKKLVFHNAKFDWQFFKMAGFDLKISDDTMIMAHLDDTNREQGLKFLVKLLLGRDMISYEEAFGGQRIENEFPERVSNYCCRDVEGTMDLYNYFLPRIDFCTKIYGVEIKLVRVVAMMEMAGIGVDKDRLTALRKEFEERIPKMQRNILDQLGVEIDLNSTDKLSKALVSRLNLPLTKKTAKSGKLQLDKEILQDLADEYPIAQQILDFRKCTKMVGTFISHLFGDICEVTGRIHCSFFQVGVCSGRMSCSCPNMQQIPKEKEFNIRAALIPRAGFWLVSIDFNQVEVRIILVLSGSSLLKGIREGEEFDLHREIAMVVFGRIAADVTSDERSAAKATSFGIAYGMNEYSLSKRLKISVEKARAIMSRYFKRMDGLREFIDSTHRFVLDKGYVETPFGRRRYFPELKGDDEKLKERALRGSVNHKVQGCAADVLKIATVKVANFAEEKWGNDVRILLSIHDELVFEVNKTLDLKEVVLLLQSKMEMVLGGIRLTTEASYGDNWGEMQKIKRVV